MRAASETLMVTTCLICALLTGAPSFTSAQFTSSRFTLKEPITSIVAVAPSPHESSVQRGWGRGRWGRSGGARAAIILGGVATVAGAAVLVYANRPECSANHAASGCSYGTKVVGGAVLAGGVVTIAAGALTWR